MGERVDDLDGGDGEIRQDTTRRVEVHARRIRGRRILVWTFVLLIVCYFTFHVFFRVWRAQLPGMYPSFPDDTHAVGYRYLLYKPSISDFGRGDVIVCAVEYKGIRWDLITRIVGVPGDVIKIFDDDLIVNGNVLPRSFARSENGVDIFNESMDGVTYEIAIPRISEHPERSELSAITVPDGCVLVLGDNRHMALDSREIGSVPVMAIKSRILFK